MATDTDGVDGNGEAAGAILRPDSMARAEELGLDPSSTLRNIMQRNSSANSVICLTTGPTRTNINDYRVILIP